MVVVPVGTINPDGEAGAGAVVVIADTEDEVVALDDCEEVVEEVEIEVVLATEMEIVGQRGVVSLLLLPTVLALVAEVVVVVQVLGLTDGRERVRLEAAVATVELVVVVVRIVDIELELLVVVGTTVDDEIDEDAEGQGKGQDE